jgi:hypothetical protein
LGASRRLVLSWKRERVPEDQQVDRVLERRDECDVCVCERRI